MLAADVVALQEVDGEAAAATVFPSERYVLHMTADRVVQRVGFAVRRGLDFTANPDLTALELPGSRLRSGADITLRWPGGQLRLLTVHLKQGCRQDRLSSQARAACPVLRTQLAALQGWVAQRQAEAAAFVLLGDFNRWMDAGDAFFAALQDFAGLLRATEGRLEPVLGRRRLHRPHHRRRRGARLAAGGDVAGVGLSRNRRGLARRLSDHCPVSVRLALPEY